MIHPLAQILFLFLALKSSHAGEIYPKHVPLRYYGIDQGNVASCTASAEVFALEQTFANLGFPVKLSVFYRHAKIWQNSNVSADPSLRLSSSPEDNRLLNAAGALIPDYMWPEDGEGIKENSSSPIPSISRQALIDPAFPRAEFMGFREVDFLPNVANMRAEMMAGHSVVLSMHSELFEPLTPFFDLTTGLPKPDFPLEDLGAIMRTPPTHAVAVVGFDDALQSFIIKNSWNTPYDIQAASSTEIRAEKLLGLQRMRLKIASRNLPGYYALPYSYIDELAKRRYSSYTVLYLDYTAYAKAYMEFAPKYKTAYVPFVCTADGIQTALGILAHAKNAAPHTPSAVEKYKMVVSEAAGEEDRIFSYAKLPVNTERREDRIRDFFSGAYQDYYCGKSRPGPDLRPVLSADPRAMQLMLKLGQDPTSPMYWNQFFHVLFENYEKGILKL